MDSWFDRLMSSWQKLLLGWLNPGNIEPKLELARQRRPDKLYQVDQLQLLLLQKMSLSLENLAMLLNHRILLHHLDHAVLPLLAEQDNEHPL